MANVNPLYLANIDIVLPEVETEGGKKANHKKPGDPVHIDELGTGKELATRLDAWQKKGKISPTDPAAFKAAAEKINDRELRGYFKAFADKVTVPAKPAVDAASVPAATANTAPLGKRQQ